MQLPPSVQQTLLPQVTELTITRPDDWHAHLRDGAALEHTCADLARYFGRVIVMPNLSPPATTVAEAALYRERILAAMAPLERRFEPLMTLYLTDRTDAAEIQLAAASSFVHAVKLYPAGATTNVSRRCSPWSKSAINPGRMTSGLAISGTRSLVETVLCI